MRVSLTILRKQRAAVLRAMQNASEEDAETLQSIINLLDSLHDAIDDMTTMSKRRVARH